MSEERSAMIERVRKRAYELWEQAGRPSDRDEAFWAQAHSEIEAEELREQDRIIDDAHARSRPAPPQGASQK